MADTIFNIFGDNLHNPVHKQVLRVHKSNENGVGKASVSTNVTPGSKAFQCATPRHTDQKKKSFLQNKGTPLQQCPGDYRKSHFQNIKKNFTQIYEDAPAAAEPPISLEDEIQIQFTPPNVDDDAYLSDTETVVTDKHIDQLVFDLPRINDLPLSSFKTFTMEMDTGLDPISFDDVLADDSYVTLDEYHIGDSHLPVPF